MRDGESLPPTGPSLRVGLAAFGTDRALTFHNSRLAELLGVPSQALRSGQTISDIATVIETHDQFPGPEGRVFLNELHAIAGSGCQTVRGQRADRTVVDVTVECLPDGRWSLVAVDAAPLLQAEEAARRRAALLDGILHQVPHGIIVYGPDMRILMMNEAYGQVMSGAPAAVGELLVDVVRRRATAGEYGPGTVEEHVAAQTAHDTRNPQMRRRRRPDGRMVEIRTAPLPDGGYVSVVSDISSLVEAQADRSREAELLASIVSHIPHGVSVYGPDRGLRLVNAAYDRIMAGAPISIGETVEQVIEKRALAGEYGPGPAEVASQRQSAIDNTRPQFRRRRRPNGTTIDVRTAPLPDGGHISVVTDVTPLVAAEAELGRSAEAMAAMLANIRHGIVLWDSDARIVAANDVVAEMLSAPPGLFVPGTTLEATIRNALQRGNLGSGPAAVTRARWLAEQDRSVSQHDQRLTRNGRVLEVRSDPAPGGGFVTTYTDVTHIREAEDALQLAKSAAEAANMAKSRFLASMSNELRTPLSAILAELGVLAQAARDARLEPELVRHSAEAASDSAQHLVGLIDSILDVARLEAGRFELADDLVELQQLVRHCLRQSDMAAAAAEVALVVDLPAAPAHMRCDERRMRQTLGHLIGNAVRFAGPAGSVSIGARQEWSSGDLLLTVQDTGEGLAAAEIERAFEPFTKLDREPAGNRRAAGAGLGLYIGRTLVRAHGGELELRSAPGHGTTAVMRIPAARLMPAGGLPDKLLPVPS